MATIKVTQTGSPIRRTADQRATLVGLGLNKMHKTRELEDTPAVRGMIRKVHHMVKIEGVSFRHPVEGQDLGPRAHQRRLHEIPALNRGRGPLLIKTGRPSPIQRDKSESECRP